MTDLKKAKMEEKIKIAIIGSGPAAYSAALYSQELMPVMFEGKFIGSNGPGGQLTTTTNVDNYPGVPNIEGSDLMKNMKEQAKKTKKIEIKPETITKIIKKGNDFILETENNIFISESVIISTGAQAKRMYVKGTHDDEFWNKGVSACAVCDGWLFQDQTVAVIGGGDSAMEETIYLSSIAKKIFLIHRSENFRARKDLLSKVKALKNVEIKTNSVLIEALGDETLKEIKIKSGEEEKILNVDGLFFAIGHKPNAGFVEIVEKHENGYIKTDSECKTNVEGIFACGDVQDFKYRQAITAASSGSIAAISAKKFLDCNK